MMKTTVAICFAALAAFGLPQLLTELCHAQDVSATEQEPHTAGDRGALGFGRVEGSLLAQDIKGQVLAGELSRLSIKVTLCKDPIQGLAGVPIRCGKDGGLSTTTDVRGQFFFDRVPPGAYYIWYDIPEALKAKLPPLGKRGEYFRRDDLPDGGAREFRLDGKTLGPTIIVEAGKTTTTLFPPANVPQAGPKERSVEKSGKPGNSHALLPHFQSALKGPNEVRVRNPNDFVVTAGLRTEDGGVDFDIPENGVGSVRVPDGRYDIYFVYSDKPDALFQGDSFTLKGNGVEIKIMKVVGGNYGIRQVK